ncbi:hypothetical protein F8388_000975 [Cannabis sativa]|uniref:RNase H type-1 domain-containing protein n=1 Tax=Cannabis sativa TaxID=3483 RepID=A0A7J6FX04_CANSA|nr:hypothetical protein F8388_000975 [Cannabis sativa]
MFDILTVLHNRLGQTEFEDAIKVMWAIWENRNRKWNKLPNMNGVQLLDWVFSAYPRDTTQRKATIQESNGVGLGFIWRNWQGEIMIAGMVYLPCSCSTEMAEAWAILEAITLIPATVNGQFEIQTDCKKVVDDLHKQVSHSSAISTLLHKIKTRLKDFQDYNIVHGVLLLNVVFTENISKKGDKASPFFNEMKIPIFFRISIGGAKACLMLVFVLTMNRSINPFIPSVLKKEVPEIKEGI